MPGSGLASAATQISIVRPGDQGWEDAARIEAERFTGAGFFTSREELDRSYDAYVDRTRFVLYRHKSRALAAARVVLPSPDPSLRCKTVADLLDPSLALSVPEEQIAELRRIGSAKIADLATIASVNHRHPAGGRAISTSAALIGAAVAVAESAGATHMVAAIDTAVLRVYQMLFGPSCIDSMGPEVDYIGSPCVPVICELRHFWDDVRHGGTRAAVTAGYNAAIATLGP